MKRGGPKSYFAGKRVLVTGGSGFIGSNLITKLVNLGANPVSLQRNKNLIGNGSREILGDVTDKKFMATILRGGFEAVFHCAGFSGEINNVNNPVKSRMVNFLAVKNIVDIIGAYSPKTRLVVCSSRLEYGRANFLPVDELHGTKPEGVYGKNKLKATEYVIECGKENGLWASVLRISNVYGPNRKSEFKHYNVANHYINEAKKGKRLVVFGEGNQLRDYLYIDELVNALLMVGALARARGEIYNVGSGMGRPFRDLAEIVARKFGVKVEYKKWPKRYLDVELGDYVSDVGKIESHLGWRSKVSLEEGLIKTIDYEK